MKTGSAKNVFRRKVFLFLPGLSLIAGLILASSNVYASRLQQESEESGTATGLTVEMVTDGLKNPVQVATDALGERVYVVDSGNGRVVEVLSDGKLQPKVTDFNLGPFNWPGEPDPIEEMGPTGIVFIDSTLAIFAGDKMTALAIQDQPDSLSWQTLDQSEQSRPSKDDVNLPIGDFSSPTAFGKTIIALGVGDDSSSWIVKLDVERADLNRTGTSRYLPQVNLSESNPEIPIATAMTASPDLHLVCIQRAKELSQSSLVFYALDSGETKAKFAVELENIVAVTYSPSGRLYCLNHSKSDPSKSGVYKLVARQSNTACKAVPIHSIENGSSMVFDSNGHLLVTTRGTDGKLWKLSGVE